MTQARTHDPSATALKKDAVGVFGILFFVLSAQAPLTGIVGAAALAIGLGNGAGAPGAYLVVGLVIVLFAVGFTTMTRHVDSRGGFSALVGAGLGKRTGSASSWLALLSYNAIQAAMYGLLGSTASALIGLYSGVQLPWWVVVIVAIGLVYFLGSRNVEVGARILSVLVIAEFAILLAFGIAVLATGGPQRGMDFGASFSPSAIAAGAPGIAILFAIASMFGFESTAVYSGEAKDARKTVPRATYLSVTIIAIFFAFVMWMLITYYGAMDAGAAALDALGSDPASFVLTPLNVMLGDWAAPTAGVLLCTSLLAGILAFHNIINRYFHAMSQNGGLPRALQRTNLHSAPATAAATQSIVSLLLIAPFAALGLDPVATLFGWFSGLAVAALVLLYVLTSISIVVFFRRSTVDRRVWNTVIAPVAATIFMVLELILIIGNFPSLIGGDVLTSAVLLAFVPVSFLVGLFTSRANDKKATEQLVTSGVLS